MPTIPWSELTPALWAILVVTAGFWVTIVMMLVCIFVPPFRGTRLGCFFSNGAYAKGLPGTYEEVEADGSYSTQDVE